MAAFLPLAVYGNFFFPTDGMIAPCFEKFTETWTVFILSERLAPPRVAGALFITLDP
jgi:hypothetical protein